MWSGAEMENGSQSTYGLVSHDKNLWEQQHTTEGFKGLGGDGGKKAGWKFVKINLVSVWRINLRQEWM